MNRLPARHTPGAASLALLVLGCGVSAPLPSAAAPAATSDPPITSALLPGSPVPLASPAMTPAPSDVPSRLVIADLDIDLPVISGDATVPGNPPDYPLCDVAQYLTTFPYPGRAGTTTWIYGHARNGMLLPLLRESKRDDGAALIGKVVDVYSTANVHYRYRISAVLRHATDRSAAQDVPRDEGRLILQTSEGPSGTVPKLQVVARLVDTSEATAGEAQPSAAPRGCFLG